MDTTETVEPANTIPAIKWDTDSHKITWKLLTELEKDNNRPLFLGKVNKSDNTTGETKNKVCKRIAAVLFPQEYAVSPTIMGNRVKVKISSLIKAYKMHEKRLRVTGEGVRNVEEGDTSGQATQLQFYIQAEGPDENTPTAAINIWDEIVKVFPFFPRLHRYLSSRPNVVPYVVATPLGPQGGRTTWFQPPDDSLVDPVLLRMDNLSHTQQSTSPSRLNSPFSTPVTPTAASPRPSSSFREALNKATRAVPQKRPLSESMLDIARSNLEVMKRKAAADEIIATRKLLLQEFQAGVWTREEYAERIDELAVGVHHSKRQHIECSESPEWAPFVDNA